MTKNYLQHDFNSRNTPLHLQIRRNHGMEGLGIYWCIIEQLYECGGYMPKDYDLLAYDLRTDAIKVADIVMIAFQTTDTEIYSEEVLNKLIQRQESYNKIVENRSKAGKASALARKAKAMLNQTSDEQDGTDDEHVFDSVEHEGTRVEEEGTRVEHNELREDKVREDKVREEKESKAKLSQNKTIEVTLSKASNKEPKITEYSHDHIDNLFANL